MSFRHPTRRAVLGAAAVAGVASIAGCLAISTPSAAVTVREGFENGDADGLGDWTTHGHVGDDAGGQFRYEVGVSADRAFEGRRSLRVFTEGGYDDGTAWATLPVRVTPGRAYDAAFSVRAWSEGESFNTVRNVVALLSTDAPDGEADFPEPGWNSSGVTDAPVGGLREPMDGPADRTETGPGNASGRRSGGESAPEDAGWRTYRFTWRTPETDVDTLYLSVGVSVVWETDRVDYLDDVRLDLTPRR